MDRRQYVVLALFLISTLVAALVPLSGQQPSIYNPWLDYNDDGLIDVNDLQALANAYGSSGTPLNSPMALEYDSGWLDISDRKGKTVTITPNVGNLETLTWTPRIDGRIVSNGEIHQRYFDGTGHKPGWNKTYEGARDELSSSMVQTTDGGYALAGYTYSYGPGIPTYPNFLLVKTDSAGNMQWNKTYGGANMDEAHSMVQTGDGGYAIAGYTNSYGVGSSDAWLVKTDEAGNIVWNKTYGGTSDDVARSVIQTVDGGYALAGWTYSYGAGDQDVWLVKTNSNGNALWNKTYDRLIGEDGGYSVVQTSDGGYALAGYTKKLFDTHGYASWLIKTDSVGSAQWNKTYDTDSDDFYRSVVQTSDGGYALTGYTGDDAWLVKTDSSGNTQWSPWYHTFGTSSVDYGYSLVQTIDGGYALIGQSGSPSVDFLLVKTDANGWAQWSKTYGGTGSDGGYSLVQTSDGGFTLAGYTRSYGAGTPTYSNIWLVRTDGAGFLTYSEFGLSLVGLTVDTLILYRGATDTYWNYVRVRIWVSKENP